MAKKTVSKTKTTKKKHLDLTAYNRESASEKEAQLTKVSELFLDPNNPRLAEIPSTKSQAALQHTLNKHFNLQPIKDSLYRNGFFWEEPLLAVREKITDNGKTVTGLVVVEGNRRLAALKHILENPAEFPDTDARKRLEAVPVIIRTNREETLSFVGFRHITGIMPWESAAMAQYALSLVEGGYSIEEAAQFIGDTTRKIRRLIRTQSIIEYAKKLQILPEDASNKFYFSYLLTATDGSSTQDWLKLQTKEREGTVKEVDGKRLEKLWSWLYGSKRKQQNPVISESRQISKLNNVISVSEAVKELENTRNLERAYALTRSREELAAEVLGEARSMLQDMYSAIMPEGKLDKKGELAEFIEVANSELKKIETLLKSIKPLL